MVTRVALAVLLVLVVCAVVGGLLPATLSTATRPDLADLGPTLRFWLGTDRHGRDVAMRVLQGLANGVWPALAACGVAAGVGIPLGALLGRYPTTVGRVVAPLSATLVTIPRYVLVLVVMTIMGNSMGWMALAAGLAWAPSVLDSTAARVRALVDDEAMLASRLHGIGEWRLMTWHVLWHGARRTIARQLLGLFGAFLVLEASLSYIGGLGIREPRPSLGNLVAMQWSRSPWLDARFWFPIAVLLAVVGSARLVAHGLREPVHD